MFKRLLERLRQDHGRHTATVRVDFFPHNQVTPHISWLSRQDPDADTVPLIPSGHRPRSDPLPGHRPDMSVSERRQDMSAIAPHS